MTTPTTADERKPVHTIRTIFILVFILVTISLLLCTGVGILVVHNWNTSAEQKIQDSLTALDQHFSGSQLPLLADTLDDTLLPLQVGNFQRDAISDCADGTAVVRKCRSTVYNDPNQFNGFIYMTIKLNSEKKHDTLQDAMTQPVHCGPENSAENKMRSATSYRYVYTICYASLITSTGSLIGVTWTNGDWLVSMSGWLGGKPDTMIQFVNQYPY